MEEQNPKAYQNERTNGMDKAAIGTRVSAFVIDHILLSMLVTLPSILLIFKAVEDASSQVSALLTLFPLLMLAGFALYIAKDIIRGRSLGKLMLGIGVRNSEDPSEIPPVHKLFLRNIFLVIWPVELLVLLLSRDHKKLGDRIAGTDIYCVKKPNVCLLIVAGILAMVLFVTVLFFGIFSILKNDASYKTAIGYIESNPAIADVAGEIEGYGFLPMGSIQYVNGYSEASYTITVDGSKEDIVVAIQLEKKPIGDWEIIYFDYE
ncbi:MAG: RDD family protein [Clostridiales bacterium]|jgi:uncharacterized RDD family membrane protein YckC|nr:RDD family protein [Clostridiales bacterium]